MRRTQGPPGPSLRDGLVRSSVLVTLASGAGVQGVLWASDESGLVLRPAAGRPLVFVGEDGSEQELAGEMFVPAGRVEFVQVLERSG